MIRLHVVAIVLLSLAAGAARPASAAMQDSLAAARDLYVSAGYEDALAMLERLRTSEGGRADARSIEQYRAFCLFALGRTADAEQAVERAVSIDPAWELEDGEAPPRLVTFFSGVRSRVMTTVLRDRLAAAKALHADKKYEAAAEAFTGLLTLMDHPAVIQVASRELADLKTVVAGFRDLALAAHDQDVKAQEREKAALEREKQAMAAAAPAPSGAPGGEPVSTGRPATSTALTETVVPPGKLFEQVPRPTGLSIPLGSRAIIIMDVLIDEFGRVERSSIRQSVNRVYEQQLLAATKGWRYSPATQGGKAVKYVKTLEIELTPR